METFKIPLFEKNIDIDSLPDFNYCESTFTLTGSTNETWTVSGLALTNITVQVNGSGGTYPSLI